MTTHEYYRYALAAPLALPPLVGILAIPAGFLAPNSGTAGLLMAAAAVGAYAWAPAALFVLCLLLAARAGVLAARRTLLVAPAAGSALIAAYLANREVASWPAWTLGFVVAGYVYVVEAERVLGELRRRGRVREARDQR